MYRLIATDIDDTLLAPDGSFPEVNRRALALLHRQGVAVVLSSGRATVSMRPFARQIGPADDTEYLISFNGARVSTVQSDTLLFEHLISREAVEIVMDYARREDLLVHGYRDEAFLTEQDHPRSARYARDTGMECLPTPDMVADLPRGTPKLLVIGDPRELPHHRDELMKRAGGLFEGVFSKPEYLEIMAPGVSKGAALGELARHLEIPLEETIALGDSLNDLEMIATAGVGIAVANAREELKGVADLVLNQTAAQGAVAEVARRFWGITA
ncbi:Cof-type HAD-IIB family hydrolase [Alkalispirochaeta alkalica]|uniref:Cof-type HAD-IIB family hydrolase n=1 Tax=Alkalispirochaeta alkalica TaxID=46356 RepID=UPI00037303E0|nr:Cof-type HAD-IIB family hydrolase [Alkalispirochaeta alkalica]